MSTPAIDSEDLALGANDLADKLLAFAHEATDRAATLIQPNSTGSGLVLDLMQAARGALEARKLAEEPLSDGERAATAAVIRALREKAEAANTTLGSVVEQRNELATFLGNLAAQFETAQTDTATRVAARIRRELADVLTPGETEAARDRLRARGVELPEDENVPRPEAGRMTDDDTAAAWHEQ